jgi:two-component system, LytTR family, response regulator
VLFQDFHSITKTNLPMVKAILIDDEVRGLRVLEHLISKFEKIQVVASCTSSEEAIDKIDLLKPNLVLLDINMPKFNGFQVLENVTYKNFKSIFITAHNEFAIKAFKYSAIDYLLKPVEEDLFDEAIERALLHQNKDEINENLQTLMHNMAAITDPMAMKVCINNIHGFSIINSNDILYCEADSSYTKFKLSNGTTILSAKTLSEFESILDQNQFFRIHRSFMINLTHIKEYIKGNGGHVIMQNGVELEVSRRKKDEFISKFKTIFKS